MSDFAGVIEASTTSAPSAAPPAAPPSAPSETAAQPSTPASVSVTPETTPSVSDSTTTKPLPPKHEAAIPFERFHEVNSKYQDLQKQYGWLPQEHAPLLQQFWTGYQQDPITTLVSELEFLATQPQYAQAARSAAARLLGMRGEKAPEPTNVEPQYHTPDGKPVYTADQVQALIDQKLAERLQPIEQDFTTRQHEQVKQQVMSYAQSRLEQLKAQPHFTEHQDAIKQLYTTKYTAQAGYGHMDGLLAAYNEVLTSKVLPSLSQTERQAVLSDLQSKAQASTVNPGRPTMSPPAEAPKDFREALTRQLGG